MPLHKNPLGYDVICVPTSTFGSTFIRNVEFHNYKLSYTGNSCNNNRVFHNHASASDATHGHYLTAVTCTGCENDALFRLDEPKTNWFGWFGGCGDVMTCTGLENVLV